MVARQTAQTYSFAGLLAAHRERKVHPKPADYDLSCEGGFVPILVILVRLPLHELLEGRG